MIIWLASYPKSGNTLVRSMLSAYFFSKNGIFDFDLIKNIKQFPNIRLFENQGIDITNEKEVIKNYIKVQETFNKKDSIQFLKTHSYLFNIENHGFTDLKNSLGVIYIVRDPRNIAISWAKYANISFDRAADTLINTTHLGGDLNAEEDSNRGTLHLGTWDGNFRSWKSFNLQKRYLLIKYEDLIAEREKSFLKILKFIFKLSNTKFNLDKIKFENVLETTDFKKMKELEKKKGFSEAAINKKTGEQIPFFNLGPKNNWEQLLDNKIKKKIENAFEKEMIELRYL